MALKDCIMDDYLVSAHLIPAPLK